MAATVRVSDIEMPGMFRTKRDDIGDYWETYGFAYIPMPYALGEICERCWLSPRIPWDFSAEWTDFDEDYLRTVGHDGCPHGGGAA
jgi:hypothetical protein